MKRLIIVIFCLSFAACAANTNAPSNQPNNAATSVNNTAATDANSQTAASKPNPAQAVKFSAEPATIKAGGQGEAVLKLNVVAPFHVNSNPPSEKSYIPLEVQFENQNGGVQVGKPIYPKGEAKTFAFSEDKPLLVYTGETTVKLPLKIEPTAAKGAQTLTGKISFQPCDDEVCYRPQTIPITISVTVN